MATQKITMGRGRDTDYESKKAAALAQAGMGGDFVWGVQSVYENGTGQASKASRDPRYGNVNITTGDALDGTYGNFKPATDSAGNQVTEEPRNQLVILMVVTHKQFNLKLIMKWQDSKLLNVSK